MQAEKDTTGRENHGAEEREWFLGQWAEVGNYVLSF